MSGLWQELSWRGLVHQTTDESLGRKLDDEQLTFYVGLDPTAPSLHIGNLLQLCNLRRLQEAGHRPVALCGGGTGMIGDPGGRSDERNLLTAGDLEVNLAGIRGQIERFVGFSEGRAILVDNGSWLWEVGLLEFLRDIGKHFTINQMVAKDSVRARFEGREQGISYTEFSYMLLQAYDFLQLFDAHDCRLQFGGSDQWGNITMGIELIRKLRGQTAYGFTSPLVLNADGTKMGKSAAGDTIWLDAGRTSPYALFQHFIRVDDAVVGQYLRFFTWLPRERIEELEAAATAHPERREAQQVLAWELTALIHNADEADRAANAADVLFSEDIAGLDTSSLLAVLADAPSSSLPAGTSVLDALVSTGLCASKGDARRQLGQGGIYMNNVRVADDSAVLTREGSLSGGHVLLRRGKKQQHLVTLTD